MIKVLMTGAGAPGGPGIIRGLQRDSNIDLLVCDVNPEATGRFLNKNFGRILMADDDDFIDRLLETCLKHSIDVIFPLVTKELFKLAKNKQLFDEHGIKIVVSDYPSLKIANDKSALYKHLKCNNILTPDFRVANTFGEIETSFNDLGFPANPICIKPSISNGSRGVRIIDDNINELDLLFNHKPNSLYMSYDKLRGILRGGKFPEILVSEFLPGEEYTIDTIVSEGVAKVVLPRVRSKMNGGISVAGSFEENEEIIGYCKTIISSLNLSGPIGLQVKRSKEGVFKILEINPRIQGTSIAALGAGVNLPLLAVYSIMNNHIKIPDVCWNTKFVRYYEEIFY